MRFLSAMSRSSRSAAPFYERHGPDAVTCSAIVELLLNYQAVTRYRKAVSAILPILCYIPAENPPGFSILSLDVATYVAYMIMFDNFWLFFDNI